MNWSGFIIGCIFWMLGIMAISSVAMFFWLLYAVYQCLWGNL